MIIILFTVFLFNQKEVSSQTEEEQILSSSDDNIVKVLLSSLTRDTFLSNRKMCLSLKMNNDQFIYCLSVPTERSLLPNGGGTNSVVLWRQHRKGIVKLFDTWHVLVQKENVLVLKNMIINSFTVFLFRQKEVSSRTEEEQILSTSDDNIVKVFFKFSDTWHVLVQ